MTLRPWLVVVSGFLAFSATAAPPAATQVEVAIKSITDGASRTLGKSVSYCVASHLPAGQPPLDGRLKTYLAAMSSGTRDAMLQIAAKDSSFVADTPVFGPKDYAMMDKQADAMLQGVKGAPEANCAKLGTVFDAGSAASFKAHTLDGYQQYLARRAQYCAQSPKPANCK